MTGDFSKFKSFMEEQIGELKWENRDKKETDVDGENKQGKRSDGRSEK